MKRFIAGIGSLLLLGALLAGIPALLILVAGNPIPSFDELRNGFTQPDYSGQFLLGTLLPIVAWIAWATFAVSILTVLPAMVRGIEPPNIPGLNVQQRTMVSLLGAVLIMFTAFVGTASAVATSVGSDAAPAASSNSAQQDSTITAQVASEQADEDTAAEEAVQLPTYRVQSGDTLWTVAQAELGDGKRYVEIAELNYGVAQPDGGALGADHWLAGGWTLLLPEDARATADEKPALENDPAVTAAAAQAESASLAADSSTPSDQESAAPPTMIATDLSVTISPGDTLWDIAEAELGAGDRYGEIYAASQGTIQSDGSQLSNPDMIHPGWSVTVPGAGEAIPAAATPTPAPDPQPAPVTSADRDGAVVSASGAAGGINASAAASAAETDFAANITSSPAATAGGVSALLASSLLGLLGVRRLSQRRRRRAGERSAAASAAALQAERELSAVADAQIGHDIDRALRFVAVAASKNGQSRPALFAVRRTPLTVELFFDGLTRLPAPFFPINGTTAWSAIIADIPVFATEADPYPALVPIGLDDDNAEVLIDLHRLGSLAVVDGAGTADAAGHPVLIAMASALASGSWCDSAQVTLVGCGSELVDTLGLSRFRYVDEVEVLLTELRDAASTHSPLPDDLAIEETRVRAPGAFSSTNAVHVVLLARMPEPGLWDEVLSLIERIPNTAVVVGSHVLPPAATWTFVLDGTGSAILNPAGLTVRTQALSESDYRELVENLGATELPLIAVIHESDVDEETRPRPVPGAEGIDSAINEDTTAEPLEYETRVADAAARAATNYVRSGAGEAPIVRLLGPVQVDGAQGTDALLRADSAPALATELIAYVALHPESTLLEQHNALWPGSAAVPLERLHEHAAWAAEWLGSAAPGSSALFLDGDGPGGYRLDPAITTDWHLWQALVGQDVRQTPTAQLVSALQLITGHPFAGVPRRRFGWASVVQTEMIESIVDAAHELAERSMSRNDVATARIAALVGEKVDPASQIPVRDALRAEDLASNTEGFEQVVARLNRQLAALPGERAFDETTRLIDELRKQRVTHVSG